MKIFNLRNALGVALASAVLLVGGCGGGGGGGGSSSSSSTTTTSKPVASILLTTSQSKIKSDGSDSTTVKATALDADHAAIAKAVITFKADSGALSAGSVTAGTDGAATVTFTAGSADPSSRTATITASVGSVSQQIPVVINGATISVTSAATNLVVDGTSSTVTATLKDASGNPLANTTVSFASSGSGSVTLSPDSGKTNSSGQLVVAVKGAKPGTAVVTATGAGEKATTAEYVVTSSPGAVFTITSHPSKSASASLETTITITVQAPSSSSVTFVSSLGGWDSTGRNTITKAVDPDKKTVSADLKASIAGVATVQIYDEAKPSTVDKMTVAFSASLANAYRITIQATPTVVPQTLGSTSGISTLIATVTDLSGNPVGDAPVAFEIIKNTGGGETVSPAIVMTAGTTSSGQVLGQAKSTFTAGSLSSTTGGVVIRASVVGKSLTTSIAPSGDDAKLTIGGTAGSVSIGRSTVTEVGGNNSLYIMPISVVVADSNGNSVVGAKVSLSSFPVSFNADGRGCEITSGYGDFLNEDRNENQALDPGEDGLRIPFPLGVTGLLSTSGVASTSDGKLTPPNSASGTLPSTVTTDASGVATFNLTYTKSNALWIFARIRASVIVLGTETVGESVFRLPALEGDIGPCRIPNSPYLY